jgi:hypothetical protein
MTQQSYPPPPVPPPGPYAAPPIMPPGATLPKGQAVAALVCGIVSLVFSCVPFLGLVLGILGTAFGGLVLGKVKRGQAGGKGMAIAGLVCGIVGIVDGVVMTIWYLVAGMAWWSVMSNPHIVGS